MKTKQYITPEEREVCRLIAKRAKGASKRSTGLFLAYLIYIYRGVKFQKEIKAISGVNMFSGQAFDQLLKRELVTIRKMGYKEQLSYGTKNINIIELTPLGKTSAEQLIRKINKHLNKQN